jgi:hypothetical protein
VTGRRRAALADDVFHLGAHTFERDAQRFESLGGDAFTLVNEAEEDVLGADVRVIQEARFFLRENHDTPCPVGEAFEQFDRPYLVPFGTEIRAGSVPAALGQVAPGTVT